jgi:hypothetical protein
MEMKKAMLCDEKWMDGGKESREVEVYKHDGKECVE